MHSKHISYYIIYSLFKQFEKSNYKKLFKVLNKLINLLFVINLEKLAICHFNYFVILLLFPLYVTIG